MDPVVLLDFAHDEGTLDGANTLDVAKLGEDEILILLHVAGTDLQQVIVSSGGIVALSDLWNAHDTAGEGFGYFAVDLLELYLTEYLQALAQLFSIKDGYIFLDIALTFKPLLPLKNGCGGQVNGFGQFLGGQFGILLQRLQYLQIGSVEFVVHCRCV